MVPRVVVCAANRYTKDGSTVLILGARHFDRTMHDAMDRLGWGKERAHCHDPDQGFIDQFGVYMDRKEALAVATASGQVGRWREKCPGAWLCSEDLY
jgi:hypothetical protein